MSAQVKFATRKPGMPAGRAATRGNGGASQSRAAMFSSRSHRASSSTRAMASAWTPGGQLQRRRAVRRRAVSRRIDRAGVRDVVRSAPPDGQPLRQWGNRLGCDRMTTGRSAGTC